MQYLQKLRLLLSRKEKINLILLAFFSIAIALIESVAIAAIMPFVDMATNFSAIENNVYYQSVFTFFNFQSQRNFAIAFGLSLFVFYLFRIVITLLYTFVTASFGERLVVRFKEKIFKNYLAQRYQDWTNQNHSQLTKTIVVDSNHIGLIIKAILTALSEVFVVLCLYSLMLIANWKITLVFTLVVFIKLLTLTKPVARKIKKIGAKRQTAYRQLFELLNRSFGNFQYIKLQSNDFINKLHKQCWTIAKNESITKIHYNTLSITPRLFLETLGFSLVILLLVYLLYKTQGSLVYILPTLSLYVLALYRLLPSINHIIGSYNTIFYYHKSIDIVSEKMAISKENIGNGVVTFANNIQLNNVCFQYSDEIRVLDNINLTINKGEKIAFIGDSGAGKSTLVDLIIGLYNPKSGNLMIDNNTINENNVQSWRAQVGYIPQQIYLFDGTVAENVCFGREIDKDKLISVLKQANIFDFLQQKSGVSTLVGEGGVQLSGGQKQRIAIARALYGNPEVLVLDEATSALDNKTESKIMDEIYKISANKTLIIIAHRLSTIKHCNKIYRICNGAVTLDTTTQL